MCCTSFRVLQQPLTKQLGKKDVGSQFEGIKSGMEVGWLELEAAGHIESALRKQRETNVGLFIHSKATAYGGCGAAYVQSGHSFLGKTSRNFLTGTSNSVPPMCF